MVARMLTSSYPDRSFVQALGLELPPAFEEIAAQRNRQLSTEMAHLVPDEVVDAALDEAPQRADRRGQEGGDGHLLDTVLDVGQQQSGKGDEADVADHQHGGQQRPDERAADRQAHAPEPLAEHRDQQRAREEQLRGEVRERRELGGQEFDPAVGRTERDEAQRDQADRQGQPPEAAPLVGPQEQPPAADRDGGDEATDRAREVRPRDALVDDGDPVLVADAE